MTSLTHFKSCRKISSVANANNLLTQVMRVFLYYILLVHVIVNRVSSGCSAPKCEPKQQLYLQLNMTVIHIMQSQIMWVALVTTRNSNIYQYQASSSHQSTHSSFHIDRYFFKPHSNSKDRRRNKRTLAVTSCRRIYQLQRTSADGCFGSDIAGVTVEQQVVWV